MINTIETGIGIGLFPIIGIGIGIGFKQTPLIGISIGKFSFWPIGIGKIQIITIGFAIGIEKVDLSAIGIGIDCQLLDFSNTNTNSFMVKHSYWYWKNS